jgi:ArsR family transcriptional regulator
MPHMEESRTHPHAHQIFKALGDPTRLRVLCILQDGEHCVSDITKILRVPQAKASHHLVYLHRAGLVDFRQQGLWSFYRLSPARSRFHAQLLECLGHCAGSVPGAADDCRSRPAAQNGRVLPGPCPGIHETQALRRAVHSFESEVIMHIRTALIGILGLGLGPALAVASPVQELEQAAKEKQIVFLLTQTQPAPIGVEAAREIVRQAAQQVECHRRGDGSSDGQRRLRVEAAPDGGAGAMILVVARNGRSPAGSSRRRRPSAWWR